MSNFQVTVLGCGSAAPTLRHYPSCQVVRYGNILMMVDCGEGAQVQMRRFGLPYAKLKHIFISHLHGDHFLGLPGLLSTMALHNVEGSVTVHTFAEGVDILKRIMALFCHETSFKIHYNVIDPGKTGVIWENATMQVETLPLYHRVPCVGFIFREKPKGRHINGPMAKFHNVPNYRMEALRAGEDFETPDGRIIPNSILTTDPTPARSYAYCSDTAYDTRVAEAVKSVDVIYHESTYADDNAAKARQRGHSTAREAAGIAALAGAKVLVMGHYSKTYTDNNVFRAEASEVFEQSYAVTEGTIIDVDALTVTNPRK